MVCKHALCSTHQISCQRRAEQESNAGVRHCPQTPSGARHGSVYKLQSRPAALAGAVIARTELVLSAVHSPSEHMLYVCSRSSASRPHTPATAGTCNSTHTHVLSSNQYISLWAQLQHSRCTASPTLEPTQCKAKYVTHLHCNADACQQQLQTRQAPPCVRIAVQPQQCCALHAHFL